MSVRADWQRTHTCGELREDHVGQRVVRRADRDNHQMRGLVQLTNIFRRIVSAFAQAAGVDEPDQRAFRRRKIILL